MQVFSRGILVTIGRRRKREAVNETEQKWACPPLHPSATFWAGVAKREGEGGIPPLGYFFAVLEIDFMGGFIDIGAFFAAKKDGKAETL